MMIITKRRLGNSLGEIEILELGLASRSASK
jgi:hypothetical protein